MPMVEDLSVFVDVGEHGTAATLDGVAVAGIFDHDYLEIDGIATRTAMFTMPANATTYARNSVLVIASPDINAGTYRVRTPQPDGAGMVVLPLEAQ